LKVAVFSIIANAFLDWILIKFMGIAGVALSTTLVAVFNVVTLVIILRKKVGFLGGKKIAKTYGKVFLSSALMGAIIYFLWYFLERYAYHSTIFLGLILLSVIIAGAGIYILLTYLLKMEEVKFVFGSIRSLKKLK
jgi:putative peptidoglycan lipid II flippase